MHSNGVSGNADVLALPIAAAVDAIGSGLNEVKETLVALAKQTPNTPTSSAVESDPSMVSSPPSVSSERAVSQSSSTSTVNASVSEVSSSKTVDELCQLWEIHEITDHEGLRLISSDSDSDLFEMFSLKKKRLFKIFKRGVSDDFVNFHSRLRAASKGVLPDDVSASDHETLKLILIAVAPKGWMVHGNQKGLVFSFIPVSDHERALSKQDLFSVRRQVDFCHKLGFVHLNIARRNVILSDNTAVLVHYEGVCKIGHSALDPVHLPPEVSSRVKRGDPVRKDDDESLWAQFYHDWHRLEPEYNKLKAANMNKKEKQAEKKTPPFGTNMDRKYLVKLAVVGDAGVGKSSLITRFTNHTYDAGYVSTIGVDFRPRTVEIDSETIKLELWDTAGQERFRTVTSSYYRSAHGILLVFDVSVRSSFINLERWLEEIKDNAREGVPMMLIGNKTDLENRVVDSEALKTFAENHGLCWVETSAKSNINVDDALLGLTRTIRKQGGGEHLRIKSPSTSPPSGGRCSC